MKKRARLAGTAILCLTVFQACAVPEERTSTPAEQAAQQARLDRLDAFKVSGGLGFWDDTQNFTAKVVWQEDGDTRDVLVTAPLGIGRMRLIEEAGEARVERGSREPVTGRDGGLLLARVLGLDAAVPIDAISQWIRGLPGENSSMVVRDEGGRIESLRWRDASGRRWRASLLRYATVDGLELPALLTATSQGGTIRLALSDWDLDPEAAGESATSAQAESPVEETGNSRLSIPGR